MLSRAGAPLLLGSVPSATAPGSTRRRRRRQVRAARVVTPQLLTNTVAQSHALLLQLRRQPRPLAQLNNHGIADLHRAEQLRIGTQPGRRDPCVASVILGAGNAEAVTQT